MFHDADRQVRADTEKHEKAPLPPEWVDQYDEYKPVEELSIGKEVQSISWRRPLQDSSHINPLLHPVFTRLGQWIGEIHEEKTRVDANVIVPNCPDGVDIRAVVAADCGILRWEDL